MTKPISKWIFIRAFALTAVVFSLLAETNRGGDRSEIGAQEPRRISDSALNGEANANLAKSLINVKFSNKKRKSFRGTLAEHTVLVSQQAVYRIVGQLKKRIALPFELQVSFEQCGVPDSYYDYKSHEIVI